MRYLTKIVFLFIVLLSCPKTDSVFGQEQRVYKIQVASFPSEYSIGRVKSDLGVTDELSMHLIKGRYKYFVGSFDSRAVATAYLPNVPVKGAWVVPVMIPLVSQDVIIKEELDNKTIITEMVFRIQIAADHKFVDPEVIKKEKGLQDYEVDQYFNKGWYKYNLGDFQTRAEADSFLQARSINGWVVKAPIERIVQDSISDQVATDRLAEAAFMDTISGQILHDSLKTAEGIQQIQQDYNGLINAADSAFSIGDFKTSKGYYSRASVLDPSKNYPKQRIDEIRKLEDKQRVGKISNNIKALIISVAVLILLMIAVLVLILFLRTRRKRQQKKTDILKDDIQDSITGYLFDEESVKPEMLDRISSPKDKQDLIDEIMQLYANLSGEISNKLRELYIDLGLDNEAVTKTQSHQWHVRAKGFRELAQMNIKTVNEEIENCLNSDNDILRMEAQLAMIRLNYEDPFSFLSKLQKPFTSWEQLHVYEMITRHQIHVPEFSDWLNSMNDSIVIFCIRMIRAFKQSDNYKKLLPFLEHSKKEIREEAILTLGELRIYETLDIFRERYIVEDQDARVLILQAMSKMPEDSNVDFLQGILEPSNALRLQAAEALSRIESFGVKGIETILRRSDDDLQAVARHILDSKTR
ncbi:MAG: HEAT repeat domain-containing protein [Bacteroidales bacterium]|nr:HEAT repeat domain-containing protein [Bacteroidales bacterium]